MRRAKEIYILLVMMPLMIDGTRQFPDEPRPWQWAPSRTTISTSPSSTEFLWGNGAKNPNTAENPNPHRGMVSTRVTDNREELSSRGNGPGVTLTTMSQEDAKKIQPIQNVTKLPFDFENQNTFAITNKVSSEFKNKNATFSETNTREDFNENKETRFRNSDNPEFGNNDPNMNSGGRNNVPNTQRYNPTNRQNNPDRNFPPENGNMNPPDVGGGGGDDEMPTRSFTTPQDDRSTDFRDREATTDRAATEIWSFRPTEEMTAANPNWPTRNDRRETTTRFNLEFNPGRPNSKTTTDTPDDIDAERVTPKRATYTQRMPTTQFVIVKKDPNNKREGWNRHSVLGIGD